MKQSQIQMNLSANIQILRVQNKLTQQKLADKLGVKRSLLGAWEECRSFPTLEVLVRISELFEVEIKDLATTILSITPVKNVA